MSNKKTVFDGRHLRFGLGIFFLFVGISWFGTLAANEILFETFKNIILYICSSFLAAMGFALFFFEVIEYA